MLITRGPEASGKAVALIFADGTARPVLAVKRPRIPESTAALRREASILRAVREQTSVGEGVPRVLAAGETTSGYRLIETAFTGLPAFVIVTRTNFALLANRATDWLVRLAGRRMAVPRSEWWPRVVEPRVADFEEHFGSAVEPGLLSECRRLLDSLGPLPVVWEQRDFSPWNVLVDRSGEIAAVDWESAEPEGLPLLDLVYFLTYLSFSVDRAARTGRFIESYRRSRDPGFFTGRIVRACMDRYAAELALKEPEYRAFRLLTWIVHSRSEYLQLSSATGGQPSREALERSLFFQLWRSEIR